jgi:hypothetical protein
MSGMSEAKYLSAFDAVRTSILEIAREAYSHGRRNYYTLTATDFHGFTFTPSSAGMRKHRSFAGGLANGSNRREAEVPARLPSWLGLTQSELCQQPGEGCGTLSAES